MKIAMIVHIVVGLCFMPSNPTLAVVFHMFAYLIYVHDVRPSRQFDKELEAAVNAKIRMMTEKTELI